jgi:glucokinase
VQGRESIRAVTVAAIEVGGTHVSAARVDVSSAAVEPASRLRLTLPEEGSRAELLEPIVRAARSVAEPGTRLGVAFPAPFDYESGVCMIRHKLAGLYGVDLRAELADSVGDGRAIAFLNDADAFLLGEAWAGAARGHTRAAGITLGTGIGSAFLEDGLIVDDDPRVPPEGSLHLVPFRGAPVEDAISSRGVLARYGPEPGLGVSTIAARARAGEAHATEVFRAFGSDLAEFVGPWLEAFAPTCLVAGGSIARAWDLFGPELERAFPGVAVGIATNIDDAALLGAASRAA